MLAFTLVVIPGCLEVGAFACQPDACDLDGREGVCEPQGWCSYPDGDCDSGRRFESRAPGALGGACVDPASPATDGTSTSNTTGTTSATTGDTGSSEESAEGSSSSSTTGPTCDGHGCGWTHVESGPLHTCAIDGNGAVWCWGVGASGELGIGSNATFRDCPVAPAGQLVGQEDLSVGGHTCSLSEGVLHCWGPNGQRQIDWAESQGVFLEPHAVMSKDAVRAVGAGNGTTCVGIANRLVCWGGDALEPDVVMTPAPIEELGIGIEHGCTRLTDGSVWCVGSDMFGQLGGGPGDQTDMATSPNLSGEAAIALAAGAAHTCVITEPEGARLRNIKCWGDNQWNQAGSVGLDQIDTPRDVSGDLGVGAWVDISAGDVHSCAINEVGEVWCWGDNAYGQVDPSADETLLSAARIDLDPPVDAVDIAVGATISCALDRQARWWCWGCLEPWMLADTGDCTASPPTLFEPCG